MGICSNCIYLGNRFNIGHHTDFFCKNESNQIVDFVTGVIHLGSCRQKNNQGECLYFDDGHIALFAWTKGTSTIYTKSETPNLGDKYVDNKAEDVDAIKNVISLYAWGTDSLIYTKSSFPEVGDFVYDSSLNLLGEITDITDDTITYNDEVYGISEKDIPYAAITTDDDSEYIRDSEKDFDYLPDEGSDDSNTTDNTDSSDTQDSANTSDPDLPDTIPEP